MRSMKCEAALLALLTVVASCRSGDAAKAPSAEPAAPQTARDTAQPDTAQPNTAQPNTAQPNTAQPDLEATSTTVLPGSLDASDDETVTFVAAVPIVPAGAGAKSGTVVMETAADDVAATGPREERVAAIT